VSATPAIEVEGLVCAYGPGGFTLHVPAFTLARGEAVALVGPSGSGKTTFLHALAGVLEPRAGRVAVDGMTLRDTGRATPSESARRRFRRERLGLVFQELELIEHVDVRDNLLLAWHLGARPCPWPEAEQRAAALAGALGIAHYLARKPRALSQGERQRVAVGRALATEPAVILADEPTGNLDAASAKRVLDLLLAPVRERSAALLLVTHDPALLPRVTRVVEMAALARGAA
jgi:putative ABC transport system ATP-binding protein